MNARFDPRREGLEDPVALPHMIATALNLGLEGKYVDAVVCSHALNFPASLLFKEVEMGSTAEFELMLSDADKCFAFMTDDDTFHFCALYHVNGRCPLARVYSHRQQGLENFAPVLLYLAEQDFHFPSVSEEEFMKLVEAEGRQERIHRHRQKAEGEDARFRKIFEGRAGAGVADRGVFLASDSCLTCGESVELLATHSLDRHMMMGLNLCERCKSEAWMRPTLLHFLAEKFGFDWRLKVLELSKKDLFEMGEHTLKNELGCEIERRNFYHSQITGLRRRSGFRVIFKLPDMLNYAYIVQDQDGKQVGRFDSSNHHRNLPVQPDHFHPNPLGNNSEVESSYLTGLPQVDAPRILTFLEKVEG